VQIRAIEPTAHGAATATSNPARLAVHVNWLAKSRSTLPIPTLRLPTLRLSYPHRKCCPLNPTQWAFRMVDLVIQVAMALNSSREKPSDEL
jgi:hypothetical protein